MLTYSYQDEKTKITNVYVSISNFSKDIFPFRYLVEFLLSICLFLLLHDASYHFIFLTIFQLSVFFLLMYFKNCHFFLVLVFVYLFDSVESSVFISVQISYTYIPVYMYSNMSMSIHPLYIRV